MKRLMSILVCLLMVCALATSSASEGNGLQILNCRTVGEAFETVVYANAGGTLSEKDFTLTMEKTEVPVHSITAYSKTSEGTSWILVVEPISNGNARKMVTALVNDLVSNLGSGDKLAVYNALSGEKTELLSSTASIMPAVDKALKGNGKNKLYNAIQDALSTLRTNQDLSSHKCLLVISQGKDQGSNFTLHEACEKAADLPITIYTVCVSQNATLINEFGTLGRATESGLSIAASPYTEETGHSIAQQIRNNEKNVYTLSALLSDIPADTSATDITVNLALQKGGQKMTARAEHVDVTVASPKPADCSHEWEEATCTAPKTCKICGATEGEPLGHDFDEATCTEPKTCSRCGETEGEPLGHDFSEASFFQGGKCSRCSDTIPSGLEAMIHDNPVLAGMGALLAVLLIVVIIVLAKRGKHKGEPISSSNQTTEDPTTKPLRPKVTVELTEKKTGKKYSGGIYTSSLQAGLQSEMKLEGDSSISRKQMEFIWQHGILYVQDMNSKNGTRVNGQKIDKAVALHHNDIIHVGETDYIVNWITN